MDVVGLDGPRGLLAPLALRFISTALDIELSRHLGYGRHETTGHHTGNSRNGATPKLVTTDLGDLTVRVPRDRAGTFRPMLVPKRGRRLPGVGATVLLLYAVGVPPRLAMERIVALYQRVGSLPPADLPPLLCRATARDVRGWRLRALPRPDTVVLDKAGLPGPVVVYAVIGRTDGHDDIHGLWAAPAGARQAPEPLVAALRRITDAPAAVHTHDAPDVALLARRAWPRANVVADAATVLSNPFRADVRHVMHVQPLAAG